MNSKNQDFTHEIETTKRRRVVDSYTPRLAVETFCEIIRQSREKRNHNRSIVSAFGVAILEELVVYSGSFDLMIHTAEDRDRKKFIRTIHQLEEKELISVGYSERRQAPTRHVRKISRILFSDANDLNGKQIDITDIGCNQLNIYYDNDNYVGELLLSRIQPMRNTTEDKGVI